MNRTDLQKLSKLRLREARALLKAKCHEGAYYLTGYAVECALKACIAKRTKRHDFPDKGVVNESYTHDLAKLIKTAGMKTALRERARGSGVFEAHWAIVKLWNESSRYEFSSRGSATDLYAAVTRRDNGVLPWIRQFW